jgi:G:T-mismatch repair DNA endonuclease (very short patch repair protein)
VLLPKAVLLPPSEEGIIILDSCFSFVHSSYKFQKPKVTYSSRQFWVITSLFEGIF